MSCLSMVWGTICLNKGPSSFFFFNRFLCVKIIVFSTDSCESKCLYFCNCDSKLTVFLVLQKNPKLFFLRSTLHLYKKNYKIVKAVSKSFLSVGHIDDQTGHAVANSWFFARFMQKLLLLSAAVTIKHCALYFVQRFVIMDLWTLCFAYCNVVQLFT